MRAVAAVDVALWDLEAKALRVAIHDLIGGKSRDGVIVYGHANGSRTDETVEAVVRYIEHGYRAVRAQSGIPGVHLAYGVGRVDLYYGPVDAALPTETPWNTETYLDYIPALFEKLRDVHGSDVHLLRDGHR
jgi:mannonate dehydratase